MKIIYYQDPFDDDANWNQKRVVNNKYLLVFVNIKSVTTFTRVSISVVWENSAHASSYSQLICQNFLQESLIFISLPQRRYVMSLHWYKISWINIKILTKLRYENSINILLIKNNNYDLIRIKQISKCTNKICTCWNLIHTYSCIIICTCV